MYNVCMYVSVHICMHAYIRSYHAMRHPQANWLDQLFSRPFIRSMSSSLGLNPTNKAAHKPTRTAKPTKKPAGLKLPQPSLCRNPPSAAAPAAILTPRQPTKKPASMDAAPRYKNMQIRMTAATTEPVPAVPTCGNAEPVPVPTRTGNAEEVVIDDRVTLTRVCPGDDFHVERSVHVAPARRVADEVMVETMLAWPNATSAGVRAGTFPFYVIRFVGETNAVVVTPLVDSREAANFEEIARNAGWPVN